MELLGNEIELEVKREENMIQFIDSIQELIDAKEVYISNEKELTKEIIDARSKLRDGAVAETLDKEVEQRLSVAAIERQLVDDLFECRGDLQILLEGARSRAARTRQTMDGISRPDTRTSTPYDWTDIDDMELVLQEAADNVSGAEKHIREVSQRIDDALVNRAIVLGEDVPPGLAKTAQRAAARSIERASYSPDIDFELNVEDFWELKNKDEKELFMLLAKSVGSTTVDVSKAAVYGLKAILDAVTDKPVIDAANEIVYEVRKDKDESKELAATVLDTVGKAGTTVVKDIGQSDSAQVAGQALKKTRKDLFVSLETAAALGVKLYHKMQNRIEEKTEGREKEHTG